MLNSAAKCSTLNFKYQLQLSEHVNYKNTPQTALEEKGYSIHTGKM